MEEGAMEGFSNLFQYLHSAYDSTSMTCQVLTASCYNHQNVLKRWSLPCGEEICECTCEPCFDEPERIEKDVVNVMERGRATREQIIQIDKKTLTKRVHDKSVDFLSSKQIQKGSICSSKSRLLGKDQQETIAETKNSTSATTRVGIATNSKKLVCSKPVQRSAFQTTYQRDFSNQKSYCVLKPNASNTIGFVKGILSTSGTKLSHATDKIDVDTLLKNVAGNVISKCNSVNNIERTENRIHNKACSVHGESTSTPVQTYVGLKEAIDFLGVPSELLKWLRIYHQYIKINSSFDCGRKEHIAKDLFLHQLNESNEKCWNRAPSEPVINLYLHHLLIFVEILSKTEDGVNGTLPRNLEEEINSLNRNYHNLVDMDMESGDKLFHKRKDNVTHSENIVEERYWALAGMWNRKCWNMISDLKNSQKISYKKKDDCKLLQKNFQKMQALHMQIQILETLENDIFPYLKNMQKNHAFLSHLYKSLSALCDISALSVPVLLKM